MNPARTSSRWLAASASAGSSRRVGMCSWDQRMTRRPLPDEGIKCAAKNRIVDPPRQPGETHWGRRGGPGGRAACTVGPVTEPGDRAARPARGTKGARPVTTSTSEPGAAAAAGTVPAPPPAAGPPAGGEPFNAASWLLGRPAAAKPGKIAVTAVAADGTATEVSYGELEQRAWQAAAALSAAGVRAEERLLLCLADGPDLLALFLGGLYLGAVPVPVSTMATRADLATLARDSRARMLAVSAEFVPAAVDAAGLPTVREVVICGETADLAPLLVPDRAAARAAEPTIADSPAFWLYTSGTTGTPKAAMHRHGSLRATAETYAADVLGVRPDDVCYSAAKLFFAYGLGNSLTFPFSAGARTVLDAARATPARLAAVLQQTRPTLFFAAPTAYAAMLAADVPRDALSSVRLCVSAGEAFPADLYRRFQDRFGVELLDGIGSTEALHIFLSNRPGRVKPGTTGEVVAGYELR